MADVFLSYAHGDAERAKALARQIESEGFEVWWDDRLRTGRFSRQIESAIEKARCVVVLWSRYTEDSDWVSAEADRGRIAGKLVQVRLDGDCRIPMPFEWLQVLELSNWPLSDNLRQLEVVLEAVREPG